MNVTTTTIRVIAFQDDGQWVAQCLEYDIGAQADDIDTLRTRFEVVLTAELKESIERNGEPFAGIAPAPERFHAMWDRRSRTVKGSELPWASSTVPAPQLDFALVA